MASFLVALAAQFSPPACRAVRHEQWMADLRDARELGLSPLSIGIGALITSVASGGTTSHPVQQKSSAKDATMTSNPMPLAKIGVGALSLAILLSGGLAVGIGWFGPSVHRGTNPAARGAQDGITYATLRDDPPAEVVDLSTLIVVGSIDPATGQVTEVTSQPDVGTH